MCSNSKLFLMNYTIEFQVAAKQTPGNLISSPLSAQVVLAMAAYGAGGKTATEIRSCLSIPSDDELGLNGYQSLIEILNVRLDNFFFLFA